MTAADSLPPEPTPPSVLDLLLARFADAANTLSFDELMILDDAVDAAEVAFTADERRRLDELLATKIDGWAAYLSAERAVANFHDDVVRRHTARKRARLDRIEKKRQRLAEIMRQRGRDKAYGHDFYVWLKRDESCETLRAPTEADALAYPQFVSAKLELSWKKNEIKAAIRAALAAGKAAPVDFATIRESYSPQIEDNVKGLKS